jgi:hypothetical protein
MDTAYIQNPVSYLFPANKSFLIAFLILKHDKLNISIFYSRLTIKTWSISNSSVKHMVDQTIIEQHLKQIRKRVDNASAVYDHLEDKMLPSNRYNINQHA